MENLPEKHEREQYFYDERTLAELADLVGHFERPCLLCAPMLGRALHERGRDVAVLDVDRRFADLPGFVEWDLCRPRPVGQAFDLILCDPPLVAAPLSQLFQAVSVLCRFDFTRHVAVTYLWRRRSAVLGTFVPFGLKAAGYQPTYATVEACERNRVEFFANFPLPDAWQTGRTRDRQARALVARLGRPAPAGGKDGSSNALLGEWRSAGFARTQVPSVGCRVRRSPCLDDPSNDVSCPV